MLRVDLKDRLGRRRVLARGLEDAREVAAHAVLVGDEAGRRIGQAVRDAHLLDALAEALGDPVRQLLELAGRGFLLLLLGLVLERAQVQAALGDGYQRLAFEFGEVGDDPLVDAVGEQQNLDALLAEDLEVRAVLRGVEGLGRHIVDLVLPFLHAADVVGERHGFVRCVGLGRCEAQQAGDLLLVGEVLPDALLHDAAELAPELRILLLIVLSEIGEHAEHLARATLADRLDVLRFLEDLARDVERQVGGVHDAAHEAQVERHQLLGVVHDEDAAHVEFYPMPRVAVPEVEGCARREVEQLRVFALALDAGVGPGQRVLEVMADVLVELLVLVLGDVALGARPEGRGAVDGLVLVGEGFLPVLEFLLLHHDRLDDVVGVLAHDRAQLPAREQVFLALLEVQHDLGAAAGLPDHLDGEFSGAVRFPAHGLIRRQPGAARRHRHPVGDDEGGIEADAELADQVRVLLLVARELGEELARAGLRDRAEVRDDLLAAHADAVVGHRQGLGILVEGDADPEVGIALEQPRVVQRLETQLVAGVGGVGHQLAQEDLPVGVQGVDHQVQELLDLGLEAEGFAGRGSGGGHGGSSMKQSKYPA